MRSSEAWADVLAAFQGIWGYSEFRPPQGEVVQALLSGQDALVVMPTGGGKSICFQLPALLKQGVTLVISPLVALMENQVQELRIHHLPVGLLHSQMARSDRRQTLYRLQHQHLRLLYLSPETLLSKPVWSILIQPELKINGLVVDEAHCLVQWGDSFRPAYRRLGAVRPALLQTRSAGTQMAIAAFTATADPDVQETLCQVLQLQQPVKTLVSPYRPNLNLQVRIVWSPRCRQHQVLNQIRRQPQQAGLVYVRTRRDSEHLSQWLVDQGCQTAAYHAGLGTQERRNLEQEWLEDRLKVVVSTSAFGMGINKATVRWVIHYQVPLLLSEYIQEVGRGGRDRQPADAISLVSEPTGWLDSSDRQRQQFFEQQAQKQVRLAQTLLHQLPSTGEIEAVEQQFPQAPLALALLHRLGQLEWLDPFHYHLYPRQNLKLISTQMKNAATQAMNHYVYTRVCRWQFLLAAFGFEQEALKFCCGHCDNCQPQRYGFRIS